MGWGTAIGEAFKIFNSWFLDPRRKAKSKEEEKQDALKKAEELAHGENEKTLSDHIDSLPH